MFSHLSVPLLSSTPCDSGQGEGKVKLDIMNLVAAGSPLTDIGFVWVFCSEYRGVSVTL